MYEKKGSSGSTINLVGLLVFLIGYYLHHTLYLSESVFIPVYLASFSGLLLLVANFQNLRYPVVSFVLLVVAVAVTSIIANPWFWTDWVSLFGDRYLRGFFVFLLAISASLGAYSAVVQTSPLMMRRLLMFTVWAVLLGCALEISSSSMRSAFELLSSPFIRFGFSYDNALRDELLYGGLRPKFLTAEPSHVTIFLTFALACIFVIDQSSSRRRWFSFGLTFLTALVIVRGPALLLVLPISTCFLQAKNKGAILAWGLLVGVLVTLLVSVFADVTEFVGLRVQSVLEGNDRSFFIRQVLPFEVAVETIKRYPFFGIGFAGKEAASDIALELFEASAKRSDWVFEAQEPLGGNGFWIIWTQLGLVGAPIFIALMVRFARAITTMWKAAIFAVALFFLNGAAPNTLRVWGFTLIFLGVCHSVAPRAHYRHAYSGSYPVRLRTQSTPASTLT